VPHHSTNVVASRTYPADPTAPMQARSWAAGWLSTALDGLPYRLGLLDDTALVVTELITNALKAGSSKIAVSLRLDADTATVAATDDTPGIPVQLQPAPEDLSGRGLLIVSAVAADWGYRAWDIGKTVWAELAVT
jgi:anti-sigma regulatory factor (Ser/Thr protein kinase)